MADFMMYFLIRVSNSDIFTTLMKTSKLKKGI